MNLSPKAKASLDRVVARFQAGDLSPIVAVVRIQLSPNCPAASWTLNNRILAYAQADDLDCRGFRQWEKAGRKVKKGAHAVYILSPREVYETDKETDERKVKFVYFKPIPVFPSDMTEGEPIDYPGKPHDPPPLADVAAALKIDVRWQPMVDALGSWSPIGNKIRVGTDDVAVFFHELAHAVHTHLGYEKDVVGQDPHRETVADFTACVLMELYGQGDRTGNAWQYIKAYNDDPLTAITKALHEIEQVIEAIEQLTQEVQCHSQTES